MIPMESSGMNHLRMQRTQRSWSSSRDSRSCPSCLDREQSVSFIRTGLSPCRCDPPAPPTSGSTQSSRPSSTDCATSKNAEPSQQVTRQAQRSILMILHENQRIARICGTKDALQPQCQANECADADAAGAFRKERLPFFEPCCAGDVEVDPGLAAGEFFQELGR